MCKHREQRVAPEPVAEIAEALALLARRREEREERKDSKELSVAFAPLAFFWSSAARTFLTALRIAVLRATLRAVRVMRWRAAFWDDLMFATEWISSNLQGRHHDQGPAFCQGKAV